MLATCSIVNASSGIQRGHKWLRRASRRIRKRKKHVSTTFSSFKLLYYDVYISFTLRANAQFKLSSFSICEHGGGGVCDFRLLTFSPLLRENSALVRRSKFASCVFRSIVQNGTKQSPPSFPGQKLNELRGCHTMNRVWRVLQFEWRRTQWMKDICVSAARNRAQFCNFADKCRQQRICSTLTFLCRTINNSYCEGKLLMYFTLTFYLFSFCNALLNDIGLFFSSLQIYVANALDQNKTE